MKINVKLPHVNKKQLARKKILVQTSNKQLGVEWTMKGFGKPFRKSDRKKNGKNSKNQSGIAALWTKIPLARKLIFVYTLFSHSILKLEQKKFHAAKPLAFSLHFLFQLDQDHFCKLT